MENTKEFEMELMIKYDELGGVAWNPDAKVATFTSQAAAAEFAKLAPGWIVQFIVKKED